MSLTEKKPISSHFSSTSEDSRHGSRVLESYIGYETNKDRLALVETLTARGITAAEYADEQAKARKAAARKAARDAYGND